jgi:hypothetical protein
MHLGCCSTFGKRKNALACGSSIFPKVSRHPSCMDHAILHGKPFGIPLISYKLFRNHVILQRVYHQVKIYFIPEITIVLRFTIEIITIIQNAQML